MRIALVRCLSGLGIRRLVRSMREAGETTALLEWRQLSARCILGQRLIIHVKTSQGTFDGFRAVGPRSERCALDHRLLARRDVLLFIGLHHPLHRCNNGLPPRADLDRGPRLRAHAYLCIGSLHALAAFRGGSFHLVGGLTRRTGLRSALRSGHARGLYGCDACAFLFLRGSHGLLGYTHLAGNSVPSHGHNAVAGSC